VTEVGIFLGILDAREQGAEVAPQGASFLAFGRRQLVQRGSIPYVRESGINSPFRHAIPRLDRNCQVAGL
jgi:hypothetical protein